MPASSVNSSESVTADESGQSVAQEAARQLSRHAKSGRPLRITPVAGKNQEVIVLPAQAVSLLHRLLSELAAGNAVGVIAMRSELTTQQAAALLGASRPFVIKQIDTGKLPHRKIGTHRRVMLKDVLAFKRGIDAARESSLDQLAAEAQKLGLGY